MLLCGITAQFGSGSPSYKLHTTSPTWEVVDVPQGFTREQFEGIVDRELRRWAAVCKVKPQKHTNPKTRPTERIIAWDLGGRSANGGQVLADQELPTKEYLQMRINTRVRFIDDSSPRPNGIDIGRTICHEFGHFLGSLHFPDGTPAELMEGSIGHIIEPQPTEAAFMARLYGEPEPVAPGTPGGRKKGYMRTTEEDGSVWEAEGWLRRVS